MTGGTLPSSSAKVFSERRLSRRSDQRRRQPESSAGTTASTGRPSVLPALVAETSEP